MGSLGYCVICDGEYCTRGTRIVCISCGRPKADKVEPVKELDELLVAAESEPVVVATLPARKRR